jgi:hypothetical protein
MSPSTEKRTDAGAAGVADGAGAGGGVVVEVVDGGADDADDADEDGDGGVAVADGADDDGADDGVATSPASGTVHADAPPPDAPGHPGRRSPTGHAGSITPRSDRLRRA